MATNTVITRALLGVLSLASLLLETSVAQAVTPSNLRPSIYPQRLQVKLQEGSGAILDHQHLVSRRGKDLASIAKLFGRADRVARCFGQSLADLDRLHARASASLAAKAPPLARLGLWFELRTGSAAASAQLLDELRANPWVRHAGYAHVPYTASFAAVPANAVPANNDIPPTTPLFTGLQLYAGPAPVGLGTTFSRRVLGGRGQSSLRAYHVERDWYSGHEDLSAIRASQFVSQQSLGLGSETNHATAVVGVLAADRNGYGVTGMVDAIDLRFVAWTGPGDIATAIADLAMDGRPGDVAVMILQLLIGNSKPDDFVPGEYLQIYFDAIRTVTATGIVFLTAAGNGDNDLDDPRFRRLFDRSFRDSGAIMIGATDGQKFKKADFSNYGSMIDANGYGNDVATTGYGTLFKPQLDRRQYYTEKYAGTSAASSTATGAVISWLSAVRYQDDRVLLPLEVRTALRATGTAVTGGIRRRVNAEELLVRYGLPDGLIAAKGEVDLGEVFPVQLSGAVGDTVVLALGFAELTTPLGLNRPFHLDPATLVTVGTVTLNASAQGGEATVLLTVPSDPGLKDMDLYFQALRVSTGKPLHVTSSSEVLIR